MRLVKGSSGDSGVKPRGRNPALHPNGGALFMPSIKDGGSPLLPLCVPSPQTLSSPLSIPRLESCCLHLVQAAFLSSLLLFLSPFFIVSLYLGVLCFVFFCFAIVQILPCKGALGSWRCTTQVESSPSFSVGDSILFLLIGSSSLDLPM